MVHLATFVTMKSSAFSLSQSSGSSSEGDTQFPSVDTGLVLSLKIDILGNAFFLPESAIRSSSHLPPTHNSRIFICICLQSLRAGISWRLQVRLTFGESVSVGCVRNVIVVTSVSALIFHCYFF